MSIETSLTSLPHSAALRPAPRHRAAPLLLVLAVAVMPGLVPAGLVPAGLAPAGASALAAQQLEAAAAQTIRPWAPQQVRAEDYARAEQRLSQAMLPLLTRWNVSPIWAPDGARFTYRNLIEGGFEWVAVDPESATRELAFDHDVLAARLGATFERQLDARRLMLGDVEVTGTTVRFSYEGEQWSCARDGSSCTRGGPLMPSLGRTHVVSPDGSKAVFIRDHNLFLLDVATGEETALTFDGIDGYGYATNDAGWVRSDEPVVRWSPDSRWVATFRHDGRSVSMMHLVTTNVGAPELMSFRYPLPEDSLPFMIERVVIDTDMPGEVRFLNMAPDPHRSTICDHIYCNGTFSDVDWAVDGSQLAFVSSSRDHKVATLRVTDPQTGEVREVFEERSETWFESGVDHVNWSVLFDTNEFIWWSQESDWGHLYLHDLATGARKQTITSGDWNVLQVVHVDPATRQIWFIGNALEDGYPYFQHFYKVSIDSGELTHLTPGEGHHEIELSPDRRYFVDTWSTPIRPQTIVLRSTTDGSVITELEQADVSRLMAAGWKAPIPFSTKARDGQTDLYGLMYTPTRMEAGYKYPVVNYLYPGPQTGSIGSRAFNPARRDHQAIADLGFIVIEVDAMGTPLRSKSFHTAWYGDMGDNGLPDQITTIQQLAERHDFIDLDRVGIWGHSGGGFASTAGILRYPDFYKVAVSQAGNHDNRNYEDDWGEKWQGLLEEYADGTTNYDNQANQLLANNLKGKLLLAHGTMDDNVPPYNTLLVADALIAANKDFDLVLMTNRRHGFSMEPYMMRRRWDYFVQHLLGAEPPKEYEFGVR
jgi:dipeptidyl aminopeptidase/acylaminoacyl peptidase